MNDTESRLRDYLQVKAGTVSGADHGPGLELDSTRTSTRRGWAPTALAAASIGAVLILAVTFLNSLGDDQPDPAAQLSTGPVSTEAPRVPYTVTLAPSQGEPTDTPWAVLHDGGTTVKNPDLKRSTVLARLGEGWLVMTQAAGSGKPQAAIISPAGQVRTIGPVGVDTPAISPDRRQLAFPVAPYGATASQIVVVNVDDGNEVTRFRIPTPMLSSFGWNQAGIWLYANNADRQPAYLWQPGSQEARRLPDLGAEIAPARDSGTFGYTTAKGNGRYCVTAATLGANGPEVKREYCPDPATGAWGSLTLSPDGGSMLIGGPWVAVDVASGRPTKLRLPAGLVGASPVVFENATEAIVLGTVPDKNATKPTAQTIYRCRVTTGECKTLVTEKADEVFSLAGR
jgi:hypothetical protein